MSEQQVSSEQTFLEKTLLTLTRMNNDYYDKGIFFLPGLLLIRVLASLFFKSFTIRRGVPRVPKMGGAVVIATHRFRIWDPISVLISMALRNDIAIGAWAGFQSFWFDAAHLVPIENQKLSKATFKALEDLAEFVAYGGVVLIHIEGKCTPGREMTEFQRGPAYMIAKILEKTTQEVPVYLYGVEYSNYHYPLHSDVEVVGDCINLRKEGWAERLLSSSKKASRKAQADLTDEMRNRLEPLVASSQQKATKLEDVVGEFYAPFHPSAADRLIRVSSYVDQLDLDAHRVLRGRIESYGDEADAMRIPIAGEVRDHSNVPALLLAPLVYLGFALHYFPQKWVQESMAEFVASDEPVHLRGELELAAWGFSFLKWYSLVIPIVASLGMFVGFVENTSLMGVGLGLLGGLLTSVGSMCSGLLALKWYRRVNLARLELLPNERFKQHRANGEEIFEKLEEIRRALQVAK